MAKDAESVQQEAVQDGQPSGDSTSDASQTQPLTEERIAEIVQAAVETSSKRLKQSFDDKLKAELGKSRGGQPPDLGNVLGLLENADPEVKAQALERILKGQQEQQARAQQAAQQKAAYEKVVNEWSDDNTEFLVSLGLDPADKSLDWGNPESETLAVRQKKLHASAAKVIKARMEGSAKDAKKKADEVVATKAVELGLESNAAVGGGTATHEITIEDVKKHATDRDWVLAHYDEIQAAYAKVKQ